MTVLLVLGGLLIEGMVTYVAVMFGVQHGMEQVEADRPHKASSRPGFGGVGPRGEG